MLSLRWLLGMTLLAACASRGADVGPIATAKTSLQAIARAPDVGATFASALRVEDRSIHGSVDVELPVHARGALRLSAPRVAGGFVEVTALDVADVTASRNDQSFEFRGAFPDGDVVMFGSELKFEEARVLRVAGRHVARYRLRTGPAIAGVRVRERRVECVDAAGRVILGTDPVFAVDARGTRVELEPHLAGDVLEIALDATSLTAPIVLDPAWTTVASMATPRNGAAVTLLADGKVLIAGGYDAPTALSSAEVYDPVANTWTTVGPMAVTHAAFSLVRLPSGRVLTAGNSPEIYEPTSKTWTALSTTATWIGPNGFLAKSGRALTFYNNETFTATRIYNESTNSWTDGRSMSVPRAAPAMSQLNDGRIIAIGGLDSTFSKTYSTSEIYDPATDTWTAGPSRSVRAYSSTAITLPSGKVLVTGGYLFGGSYITTTELFDPTAGAFTVTAPLPGTSAPLVTIGPGRVLRAPSWNTPIDPTRVFDEARGQWLPATAPPIFSANQIELGAGRVLLAGGQVASGTKTNAATIYQGLALGAACSATASGDCASLNCIDGACCSAACDGACEQCNLTGKVGTCSPLTGTPHVGRSCAPYAACAAGACVSSCTVDTDCASTSYCVAGACVAKKARGTACTATRECASGACVDGVCCDAACTGRCEACDVPGSEGTCAIVTGAPRGTRPACMDFTSECGKVCDGKTRATCVYLPAGTRACGANACASGVETHASTCNGSGACSDVPKSCGNYICGVASCKTACATKSDCSAGNICAMGACIPAPGLGTACSSGDECSTGLCVDGVCCGVASCGAGSTCAASGSAGKCVKLAGTGCATGAECATGKCVDGVCCESSCTGNCEACDAPGQAGKCVAVRGAPHGARTACAKDATNPCAERLCDGKDVTTCAGYVGNDVACRELQCGAGELLLSAACDGAGACPAAQKKSCGGYTCDPEFAACRETCSTNEQCAEGHVCRAGACKPAAATCSTDFLERIAVDGARTSCAPFRCRAGECPTSCGSSADCVAGTVCGEGRCVAPEAGSDDGGCSLGSRRASSSTWLLVAIAIAAMARRRSSILAVSAMLLGCRREPPPVESTAMSTVQTLASFKGLAARVGRDERLIVEQDGLIRAGTTERRGAFTTITRGTLDATLPHSARLPLRLASVADPAVSVSIEALDVAESPAEIVGGAAVYRDVAPATDLLMVATATSTEEFRLLRSREAPTTFRWSLTPSRRIADVCVVGSSIELRDAAGARLLASDPIVAIDTRGTERTLAITVEKHADRYVVAATLSTDGLAYPIAVDPSWSYAGELRFAYERAKVLPLAGGDAMVVHEVNHRRERFRVATSTWTDASSPSFGLYPVAAETSSGSVLVVSGDSPRYLEQYNLTTNTWTSKTPSTITRRDGFAMLLADGRILVGGGYDSATVCQSTAQIYNPTTDTWSPAASLNNARCNSAAVRLADGRVLVMGGAIAFGGFGTTTEIYDPTLNTWTSAGAMSFGHRWPRAVRTGSKVLVVGDSASVWNGTTWSALATRNRVVPAVAPLPSGRVLIAGGATESTAEVYDPNTDTLLLAGALKFNRRNTAGVSLADGRALVVGGSSSTLGFAFDVEVFAEQPGGAACADNGECSSGFCADGRCCDKGCAGACEACNLAGKIGTCSPVSGAPVSGHATCAPYATCNAGACASSCTSDTACATGAYCSGTTCVAQKTQGATCTRTGECATGFCVDSICCATACDGQCEACNELGANGACRAITGAPRGGRSACSGLSVGGQCGLRCDGVNAKLCTYPAAGVTSCASDACVDGVETHVSSCDGIGRCNDIPKTCGAYACSGTKCATTCTTSAQCAAGFYCNGGACIPTPGLGKPCSSSAPCFGTLTCLDGVCCGTSSCPSGQSCGLPASKGTCAKTNGQSCAADAECGSGACADGVCCESSCTGQCQACNEPGNAGKCVAVKGAPRGSRTACTKSETVVCASTVCDGVDASRCAANVGTDVECRPSSCDKGAMLPPAKCDGAGRCPSAVRVPCAPYKCDGAACATRCSKNEDCADGYACTDSACVKTERRCSDDGASVVDSEGKPTACAPFVCRAGSCIEACATTTDCATGTVCDGNGRCVAPSTDPGVAEDSGCALKGATATRGGLLIVLLALAASLRRRTVR